MSSHGSLPTVDCCSTRDRNARLAARTLSVATLVLLTQFVVAGPSPAIAILLAVTLSAESLTLVIHAHRAKP